MQTTVKREVSSQCDENVLKRRRVDDTGGRRKLLVGDKVEVRGGKYDAPFSRNCKLAGFSGVGLEGCWKPGVVLWHDDHLRLVEYDNISGDDGNLKKLVKPVPVTAAIEGLANETPKNHRSSIRPTPPDHAIDVEKITYGTCVDVSINNSWWEGVIFDHQDGASTRSVFFPDQGDDRAFDTDKMRLTFEWSEVEGYWKYRGFWIFLEVLKEVHNQNQLPVSVKQIWDDVSGSENYKIIIGSWMSGPRHLWENLVSEAIQEALGVSQGQTEGTISAPPRRRIHANGHIPGKPHRLLDDIHIGNGNLISTMKLEDIQHDDEDEDDDDDDLAVSEVPVDDVAAVNCPEAILDYINCVESKNVLETLSDVFMQKRQMAKSHLVYSGWKLCHENGRCDIKYSSPASDTDKSFISLIAACKGYLRDIKQTQMNPSMT